VATTTPTPPVIASTATPANAATAALQAAQATLSALTVGTQTPLPPDARTPTPAPSGTPLPLLVRDTPRPTLTPTPVLPASLPAALKGLILFHSDRDGQATLFALDPAAAAVYRVTQEWPFLLGQKLEGRTPDGAFSAEVRMVTDATGWDPINNRLESGGSRAQVIVRDNKYNTTRPLTDMRAWNYDPVWSPAGDRIAFVSQEPGNDEIFSANADGSDLKRLTSNTWEWDKHPSWSPDGTKIVFWSNRETGRRQLWIMDADGRNQRRLLDSPYNDWGPIWVK